MSSSYSRFGGNGHDDDNDDHGIVVPSRCRLSSARRSSNDDDDDDAHRRGVGHASTSIETFFPPSCISDMRLILASNKDLDAFVGIAGSVGRMERANDDAAYDESRSIDAVAGDGGMRRNTPGASEERTDARGRAARMSSTQQSTSDGSGRGWTTATLKASNVGVDVGDDATQHNTTRHVTSRPEYTGREGGEDGRQRGGGGTRGTRWDD